MAKKSTWKWPTFAIAVFAGVWTAVWWYREEPPTPIPPFTQAEFLELLDAKTEAVGQLENITSWREAVAGFDQIAAKLPDELLPHRNKAIAYLLGQRRDETHQALAELMKLENESPESLWLTYRFLSDGTIGAPPSPARDVELIKLLEKAIAKAPDDVGLHYELWYFGKSSRADGAADRGYEALQEAFRLDGENAYILFDLLVQQALRKDSQIELTISHALEVLRPLDPLLGRTNDGAATSLLEEALAAFADDDLDKTSTLVQRYCNVAKGLDVIKHDQSHIDLHPLDYAILDYSDDFYARAPALVADTNEVAGVRFADWPDHQPPVAAARAIALMDFDLDSRLDVAVVSDDKLTVFGRTETDAWQVLTEIEVESGVRGILTADLDRDNKANAQSAAVALAVDGDGRRSTCHVADMDFVLFGDSGIEVIRNAVDIESKKRILEAVAQDELLQGVKNVVSAVLLDADHDSDVDLVVSTKEDGVSIWSSRGDSMTFIDMTAWSIVPPREMVFSAMRAVDWDRDVDTDIVLVSDSGETQGVLSNLRHGRFSWSELSDDWAALRGAGLDILEADENVSWDVVTAGSSGVRVILTNTSRPGAIRASRTESLRKPATGVLACDYDNDSWIDLLAWDESGVRGYRGLSAGRFADDERIAVSGENIRDVKAADVDGDGDVDLAIIDDKGLRLLQNDGAEDAGWLLVRAVGQQDNAGRTNFTGIGSLIELKAGNRYQARVVSGQETHFGLGAAGAATAMRIIWTNGVPQVVVKPAANTSICELMELKGSCPFIYTWDGEQFSFFTDCLWAAPIGLQVAEGVQAPSRPWEYLLIPGERMAQREGEYVLQLTEELWEAAYFDYVRLIAVDHPADVQVFSNEKVGPPAIAEFKVHAARELKTPIAASDSRGRDVLPTVRERDDVYLRGFERRLRQGVTEKHYVELDLGDLQDPQQVKLYLTGWIYPSDTSLNVSFSHNPDIDAPELPSIWTPDENGVWKLADGYIGFPGGKTKTIVVDLKDRFHAADYRVRIQTSAEIYWDHIGFTVDEPESPMELKPMEPVAAELHYRGFSARRRGERNGPESFEYANSHDTPKWPPMRGAFTRYGDVIDLLKRQDDHLAVLGAGDEMTVRFAAPQSPPPPGWRRDFILHCVGWDKDADINTIQGQSSEPLPFHAMRTYPDHDPRRAVVDKPGYAEFLDTYQTRRQNSARFWRWIKDF